MMTRLQGVSPRLWGAALLSVAAHAAAVTAVGTLAGSSEGPASAPNGFTVRLADAAPVTPRAVAVAPRKAALPTAREKRYLRASELDSKPAPLASIEPATPAGAGSRSGRVIARVLIGADGAADKVIIESAEPPRIFDRSVMDAFGAARYRPGLKAGQAVPSQMRIEVSFDGE